MDNSKTIEAGMTKQQEYHQHLMNHEIDLAIKQDKLREVHLKKKCLEQILNLAHESKGEPQNRKKVAEGELNKFIEAKKVKLMANDNRELSNPLAEIFEILSL